jgi:hypothetical protein
MTVVVVVISFSVIVSCIFISLLLVTVNIMYTRAGNNINAIISILYDGENISFDTSLVMYINNKSIPPIMIMNRMYENQNLLYIVPLIKPNDIYTYIYIYTSYRTANLQTLHFIYLVNKYTY